jgi:hypothetical protein
MAQPEIAELAKVMWEKYSSNEPAEIPAGFWHLPFVDVPVGNVNNIDWVPLLKRSVARCARVSYLNHDGTSTTEEQDFTLYDRLLGAQPIHASPAEHQAMAGTNENLISGNFHGWTQYRKTLSGEYVKEFKEPLG